MPYFHRPGHIYALALPFDLRCESGTYKYIYIFFSGSKSTTSVQVFFSWTPPIPILHIMYSTKQLVVQYIDYNKLVLSAYVSIFYVIASVYVGLQYLF